MFATFGGQVMQEGCVSAGWHTIAHYAAVEVGPDNDFMVCRSSCLSRRR